ncbi:MAG: hypothetical protein ABI623_09315 [bacterium]
MKTYKALYAGILAVALSTGVQAQNSTNEPAYFSDLIALQSASTATVEKGYMYSLRSENEGVVESALAHIASLKLAYPVKEFGKLRSEIQKIARTHASQEVRYKAFLVASLLKNPWQFAADARVEYATPDELFGALATRQQMMASNNRE